MESKNNQKKPQTQTKVNKNFLASLTEEVAPEITNELIDIVEKLVLSKRLQKDLIFVCPHCSQEIILKTSPSPNLVFRRK